MSSPYTSDADELQRSQPGPCSESMAVHPTGGALGVIGPARGLHSGTYTSSSGGGPTADGEGNRIRYTFSATGVDDVKTAFAGICAPYGLSAETVAAVVNERDALRENLTAVQARCTELVEENRRLKAEPPKMIAYRRFEEGDFCDIAKPLPFHLPTAVRAFMSAAGQALPETPTVPSDEVVRLRLRLVAEEFCELLSACGIDDESVERISADIDNAIAFRQWAGVSESVDLVSAADALADIAYVVEGTALAFGIDSDKVLVEVHASNMRKDFDNVAAGGKVRKPDGWVPPDIAKMLREMGRQG